MRRAVIIIYLLSCSMLFGQKNGTLKGVVLDKQDNTPLADVTVKLDTTGQIQQTDEKGAFQFNNLPRTNLIVRFFKFGYQLSAFPVDLQQERAVNKTVYLIKAGDVYLDEVVVRTTRRKIEGSKQVMHNQEIINPSTTLFNDTMAALKKLPGVTGTDFSGSLYIRGGTPHENLALMDDVFIIRPYHWDDRVSIFNPDMVEKVDFYTGGFPAIYGMANSGIIDVSIKKGNFEKVTGFVDLSATGLTGEVEGPVNLFQQSSFVLGVRRTHYDLIMDMFTDQEGIKYPYFDDAHLKLYSRLNDKHSLSYNVFFANEGMHWILSEADASDADDAQEGDSFKYEVNDLINSLQWEYLISRKVRMKQTFSYENINGYARLQGSEPFNSDELMQVFQHRVDWDISMNKYNSVSFGLFSLFFKGDLDYEAFSRETKITGAVETNSFKFNYHSSFSYHAGYLQDELDLIRDDFTISAGIRYETFSLSRKNLFSPRTGLRKKLFQDMFMNLGWGYYYQYTTDISAYDADKGNPDIQASQAVHYIAGLENIFAENYLFKNSVFYKDYSKLITSDPELNYINGGEGKAYGFETILQKKAVGSFDGWIAYTYTVSKRKVVERSEDFDEFNDPKREIGEWYYPDQDQRHTISIVANFRLSSRWAVYSSWDYHTGRPYTDVTDAVAVENDEGNTVYLPVKGDYNAERLPDYQRLDLKVIYKFLMFKLPSETYVQFINLYDHKNVSYYYYINDYSVKKAAYDFPFMVIGGLKVNF